MSLQTPRQLTDADLALFGEGGVALAASNPQAPRVCLTETVRKWLRPATKPRAPARFVVQPPEMRRSIDDALAAADADVAPIATKIRAWLDDDETRFSDAHDEDTQIAAANLVGRFINLPDFRGHWVEAFGLARAAKMLLRRPIVSVGGNYPKWKLVRDETPPGIFAPQNALASLIPYAAELGPEELASLKRELEPLVAPLHPTAHLALARLVRDQETIDAIARRAANDPAFFADMEQIVGIMRAAIAESRDAHAVEKIIVEHPVFARFGGAMSLAHALEHVPVETMERALLAILPTVEKDATATDYKAAVQVLACIDDDAVAEYLARRAHKKAVQSVTLDYFSVHGHHLGALEAATKQRGAVAQAAATLLDSIRRHAVPAEPSAQDAPSSEDEVPAVLRTPRWKKKSDAGDVVLDVPIPSEPATHLRPGMYANWLQAWHFQGVRDIASLRTFVASGQPSMREHFLEGLLSTIGADAAPLIVELAAREPAHNVEVLTHVISPRAMVALAVLLGKTKEAPRARAFLLEHSDVAAKGLVAAAVGKEPKLRDAGRAGVALLVGGGKRDAVEAVAKSLGVDPKLLEPDDALPAPGKMPTFANAAALPAPVLAASGAKLPAGAVETLLAILSVLPKRTHPPRGHRDQACLHPGVARCIRVDARVRLRSCRRAGALTTGALFAAGHLGSDDVARKVDAAARSGSRTSS